MITRQQLEQLQSFRNGRYLVTSCYLNLDRRQLPLNSLKIRLKDLLQTARHELAGKAASHEQRESLQRDFERIEAFVLEEILTQRDRALVVFSCTGEKFWQAYRLPRLVRNILVADHAPYLRPLTAVLAEYRRYCVVLVDRSVGRLFEVYLGEIVEHQRFADAVSRKVREAGFGGRDERAMERRHDGAVHQHYRHLAEAAFALFKQHAFDGLVLGGPREALGEFKQLLHPYLRERWVGDFQIEPGRATVPDVLAETLAVEDRIAHEQEWQLAQDLVREAGRGERAVSGLQETLDALARGQAQTLLVEDGFAGGGQVCRPCRRVSVTEAACAQCGQPTEPCADVVEEAVELALATQCEVRHVRGETPLRDAGRIGALLRYRH
jgi:peptide subunit release factor 1 (eRF1)